MVCIIAGTSMSVPMTLIVNNQGRIAIQDAIVLQNGEAQHTGIIPAGGLKSIEIRTEGGPLTVSVSKNGSDIESLIWHSSDGDTFGGRRSVNVDVGDDGKASAKW